MDPAWLKWLKDELSEVRQAKAAVATLVVVAFVGGWLAAKLFYSERIAILKQQLAAATGTAMPSSGNPLSIPAGRRLTDAEKQKISANMPPPRQELNTIFIDRCSGLECLAFADDLSDAIGGHGWFTAGGGFPEAKRPPHGLRMEYHPNLKIGAEAVAAALSTVPIANAPAIPNSELPENAVVLVIGPP